MVNKKGRGKTANRGSKLTMCIINGHYYKEERDYTNPYHPLDKNSYYIKCERCGDRRIIHDKEVNNKKRL